MDNLIEEPKHKETIRHVPDYKMGAVFAVGWAAILFAQIHANHSVPPEPLVWVRQRANIQLGINNSVNPCDNFWKRSCSVANLDHATAFTNAAEKAKRFIEGTDPFKYCVEHKEALLTPSNVSIASTSVKTAFINGVPFWGLSISIVNHEETSTLLVSNDLNTHLVSNVDCIELDGLPVLYEADVCDNFNDGSGDDQTTLSVPVGDCYDYVEMFFPDVLLDFVSINENNLISIVDAVKNFVPVLTPRIYLYPTPPSWNFTYEPFHVLLKLQKEYQWNTLGLPYEHGVTSCAPTTVNAYADVFGNEVYICGGMLQEPWFHNDYPFEINIAGIGFVIAHEMGHMLGTFAAVAQGRNVDTPSTEEHRLEFMLSSLSSHNASGYGSELLADKWGVAALNGILHSKLSWHQFAQTWCARNDMWTDDPHPPNHWRVVMALNEAPSFKSLFNCDS